MGDSGERPVPGSISTGSSVTAAECEAALKAVLNSKTFRASENQKAFLRYVGEHCIEGKANFVKEYSIGAEVFGRGPDFDPRLDPIVRVMARKLRAGLERYYADEGASDPIIVTLPKGTYVPVFELSAATVKNTTLKVDTTLKEDVVSPLDLPAKTVSPPPRIWLIPTSVLMMLLVILGFSLFQFHSRGAPAAFHPSVGVLPFTAITDSRGDEALADGLTESLIETLARVQGLRVAASASSFQFKGKTSNLREVGEVLQAQALLEGMLRKSGDQVHLTVQLVNSSNGYKLWGENYDRPVDELRALEREISRSVISAMGVPDRPETAVPFHSAEDQVTAAAYQDYLAGRRLWNQFSAASVKEAIRYFERAITRDPSLAKAYVGLANCYAAIPQLTDARTLEMNARVREVAEIALRLDSTLGEAHVALAMAAGYEHDWALAEQEYRIGLSLNPGNPISHLWYGGYLSMMGRLDEALVQRRIAAQLDPLSPYAIEALARTYFHARRYDDALRYFQQALSLQPDFGLAHQGLGRVYLERGMHKEGIDEILTSIRLLGATPRRRAFLAYAYAISNRKTEARRILNDFLEASRRGPFPAIVIADVYLGLGESEQALLWLEKVVAQKDIFTRSDPIYDSIRFYPRFTALLRRIKL